MKSKLIIDGVEDKRKGKEDRRISSGKRMDALARSASGVENRKGPPDRRRQIDDVLGAKEGSDAEEKRPPKGGYQDSL